MKLFNAILPNGRSEIRGDLVAGITLATVAIPQAIGYANIAGMPLTTGLYTILLPSLLFAVFATSRHLSIGADSSTAIILSGGLATIAVAGSAEYVSLALAVTLAVGVLLILAGIFKLGFIADFLSNTVMVAFLTGVGIVIMVGQIPGMLGISVSGNNTLDTIIGILSNLSNVGLLSLAISLTSLAVIFGSRKISNKIPDMLIVVASSIIISMILHLDNTVPTIGMVESGLPPLSFPTVASLSAIPQLSLTIVALFIVAVAKSASLSRVYALKSNDTFDENRDLISLGIANIGASFTSAFISSGTSGRTEVTYSSGGKGQLTQIVMASIVIIVLLLLTTPLAHMPLAALSAIVFVIGFEMVDIRGLISIIKRSRGESVVAVISVAAVVFLGVEIGIVFAMVVSLLYHVKQGYHPQNTILILRDGKLKNVPVVIRKQVVPGLVIYRFNSSMYYANAPTMISEINSLDNNLKWLCMDMSAVPSIDISAGDALLNIISKLGSKNVKVVFTDVDPELSKYFKRLGITPKASGFYDSPYDALNAYIEENEI